MPSVRTSSEFDSSSGPLSCENSSASSNSPKRPRLDGLPRLTDLESVQQFVRDGCKVVAVVGGWAAAASQKAESVARTAGHEEGCESAVVKLCEDDISGVMAYELGVVSVPCVLVFVDGVLKKQVRKAEDSQVLEDVRAALTVAQPSPFVPLESVDQFNSLVQSSDFTILDFYADWCAPCNKIKPHLAQLVAACPSARFLKVDRDAFAALHERCGVQKIPTFQVYQNGELKGSLQHSDVNLVKAFIEEKTASFMAFDDDF
eukprot:Rhum_TRINITY_DN15844_c0_g4::Rhum_TRINITY_DN15844_c0_g4_i1::g.162271::m.162271